MDYQKLYRSHTNRIFAGVAGGIGEFFAIDPVIIRIIFVILAVMGGGGVLIYVLLWIFTPYKSEDNFSYTANPIPDQQPPTHEFNQQETKNNNNFDKAKLRSRGSLLGAVILILLGVLLIADNFTHIDFDKFWPVILIAIGLVLLFRTPHRKNSKNDN
jgi:phage shock protein C